MTERNAWANTADTPPADDAAIETVEAERVLTLVELEGKPIGEQLAALNGCEVPSLTAEEMQWLQGLAGWYVGACATVGVGAPADILRCIAACANEVVTYNVHRQAQGDPNAIGLPSPTMTH